MDLLLGKTVSLFMCCAVWLEWLKMLDNMFSLKKIARNVG